MRKLSFLSGLAIGYVLGARAGRERYEQIRKSARDLAQTPAFQQATHSARTTAESAAGLAAEKLGDRLPPSVAHRVPYLRNHTSNNGWDSTPN